jgi:hypothetical protein
MSQSQIGAALDEAYRMASGGSPPPASRLENTAALAAARRAAANWLTDSTDTAERDLVAATHELAAAASSGTAGSNILEILYIVFKEAIATLASDQTYWLEKLDSYNRMARALSEHLERIAGSAAASDTDDGRLHREIEPS